MSDAVKDLLFRMADDALVYAHRNSEWTGIAPTLEEDIAFSSIAQDKLGHAQALYQILHELGEQDADTLAFMRNEREMKCCHFVEIETLDYAFALVRHFLFDVAEQLRYRSLETSSFIQLAELAKKMKGEIKYHTFHANTWIVQLGGNGNEESEARMQTALNECMPLALGMFEPTEFEAELIATNIFHGEVELQRQWLDVVSSVVKKAKLSLPDLNTISPVYGGRKGYHTDQLQPLIEEMTEVFRIDPSATW
jgi:ring-1,2-phenylacetyl-CoA epoxidase subunit PaaC